LGLPSRLRDRLTLPAVAAPMFLCSGVPLAVAACKSGLVGSLTRNHCRDMEEMEAQLKSVADQLARFADENSERKIGPLAMNISPKFEVEEMRAHLDVCARYGVDILITSVGDPTINAPLIHDAGILHWHDATNIRFAEKAIMAGVDGIVAIGAGGGGHAGTISHLAFIPQVRTMFDGTVVLAGAVSNGAIIRASEILGADLAYIGTRFIATREASAPDEYKAMLVDGGTPDVIYTNAVNGLPASWLKASLVSIGLDPANLPNPKGRTTEHLPEGIKPWRDVWSAGQGIGLINDLPTVAELVQRLQEEYVAACAVPNWAEQTKAALALGQIKAQETWQAA
jgi:nitronate monooxygenase